MISSWLTTVCKTQQADRQGERRRTNLLVVDPGCRYCLRIPDIGMNPTDAVLRDVQGHLQLQDLDEPYHSRGRRSAPHSADRSSMLDGSYPSSLISSRSPSPSALDNPVSLAAKRYSRLSLFL